MAEIRLQTILQISTVVVSFAVVSAPILYPRYSFFVDRANDGLDRLQQVRAIHDEVQLAYLKSGEKGFNELTEVIS